MCCLMREANIPSAEEAQWVKASTRHHPPNVFVLMLMFTSTLFLLMPIRKWTSFRTSSLLNVEVVLSSLEEDGEGNVIFLRLVRVLCNLYLRCVELIDRPFKSICIKNCFLFVERRKTIVFIKTVAAV